MTSENVEGPEQPTPLSAERERLRRKGFTDAEISRILIEQETRGHGAQAHHHGAQQGMLSNVLGSLIAIVGYVAGLFTSIPQDAATMFDPSSEASARSRAFVSFLFKAVVVGVLAFAGWQEWQQHIESAPAIAAQQVREAQAKACSARRSAIIETLPFSSEERNLAWAQLAKDCFAVLAPQDIAPIHNLTIRDKVALRPKSTLSPEQQVARWKELSAKNDKLTEDEKVELESLYESKAVSQWILSEQRRRLGLDFTPH